MGKKHTQNAPFDALTLKSFEFQEFLQYLPNGALDRAKIKRAQFVAVGMMLSRHGDFTTGTRIRPSVGTLANEAGVSKPTVRKVLEFLQKMGVLEAVGEHRNPGGGSPVTEYRLRKVEAVTDVLALKDRNYGSSNPGTTVEVAGSIGEPLRVNSGTTQGQLGNHNRKNLEKKRTNSDESESAPQTPLPSAGVGALEGKEEDFAWIDDMFSSIGSSSDTDLLNNI